MRLTVKLANDVEVIPSWEDFGNSPQDLLLAFIKRLYVDAEKLNIDREIVISNKEPGVSDHTRLWISSVEPIFVAPYVNGQFRRIYQYPVGVPMKWLKSNTKPNGMRNLADHEIVEFGEEVPPLDAKYEFVIFEP
jgi:hypothetical protein